MHAHHFHHSTDLKDRLIELATGIVLFQKILKSLRVQSVGLLRL